TPSSAYRATNDVPFHSTTSASRAIKFKGFLTTLTLPREEVVTFRGPTDRAQPSLSRFSLTGSTDFLPGFLSHFRVCSGLGKLRSAHSHLDLPLRSPTSPTLHRAVTGASVPTLFYPTYHGYLLSGPSTRSLNRVLRLSRPPPRLFSSCIRG
ncbi:hypothetical protein CRG98_045110, partial [Punica granatum]